MTRDTTCSYYKPIMTNGLNCNDNSGYNGVIQACFICAPTYTQKVRWKDNAEADLYCECLDNQISRLGSCVECSDTAYSGIIGCNSCVLDGANKIDCTGCLATYTFTNGATPECLYNCPIATTAVNPTNNGCFDCTSITSCTACSNLTNQCSTCLANHYLDISANSCNRCSTIHPECTACDYNSGSPICTTCTSQNYLNAAQTSCDSCATLFPNCTTCNGAGTGCDTCDTDYIHDGSSINCVHCTSVFPHCADCDSAGIFCNSCEMNYFLDTN